MLDGLMRKTLDSPQRFFYQPVEVVRRKSTEWIPLEDPVVMQGCELIRINGGLSIRVSDVVKHLKRSRRSVELRFKTVLGRSVLEEIKRVRLETIRRLVQQTNTPFARIATLAGFPVSVTSDLCSKKSLA